MFYRMIFSLFAAHPVQATDADASARRCDCGKRKESFAPLCCKRGFAMATAQFMASSRPSSQCLDARNVKVSSSSSYFSPVSLNPQFCCLRGNLDARGVSRGSLSRLLVASSSSGFLSYGLLRRGLCCKETLCQRYGGPGRIVQANAEASPVCGSLVDGFVAGAAAVLSRAMVFLAVVSEALVRSARAIGETLTAMKLPEVTTLEERKLVAALKGRVLIAAAPLFFAAISQPGSVSTPLTVVASGMAKWLELYSGVLMVRVLLSWFPNIPWERQPLQAVRDMCDPYLNLFRNIIPPLFNALDLSPMLAFMVLGILTSILNTTVQG
ncbi:unnamed protein product [Sphagnum jensenii]|uniref:YGGT family protein n=1 Tax=Sphagnum jensenii TaxID=128206 RepID=A0ABP1B8W8_9BRYO